ncbi:MAG: hypothetical protein HZA59_03600 [Hydrogenophilales bacterium]|nr:hypothetical protein [Hydrogenophilales bacterium]
MSNLFISEGPDPFSHLRSKLSRVPAAGFDGLWATVELQPDIFAPQRFTIGVVVGYPEGGFAFRLLSDASKFDCVYGKKAAAVLRPLIESAEYTLTRLARDKHTLTAITFESACLSISKPWPTSGNNPEQALARLFAEVVTMEPANEKQPRDFVTLDTEQVRHLVNQELKRIAGTRFEMIVVEPQHVIPADDGSGPHFLDFNLRPASGAGSVLSAVYKTPGTVELNLLRASRDLATYGMIRKVDDLALFIMTAKREQYESPEYTRLSDLIDEQSWCLERQGFRIISFDEPLPIAQSILEWATVSE